MQFHQQHYYTIIYVTYGVSYVINDKVIGTIYGISI